MILDVLNEVGLSKRESKTYIALLELGQSTTSKIIKKTSIPSSKIYEVLDRLIKKGFVSYVIKGRVKHFQALDPKKIINYLDEKKNKFTKILPQLLLKNSFTKKQSVEMYEGQKSIFLLFTDLIREAKQDELYLVFSIDEENKNENNNLFFKNLALRRKEKNLDVRLLKNIKFYKKEKHTKLKIKYTDFNLPQGITIYKDKIIILSWTSVPTAILIESEAFSNQFRKFFIELWKKAKK